MTPLAMPSPERPAGRSFLPDLLKALGCLLIVLHHLAFYGPMSDVVAQSWPRLMDWLADDGRLAVQLFLVCSGYLSAASLARAPEMDGRRLLRLAWRRYLRLATPLLLALGLAVLVTELIRVDFHHPSLSATPHWPQVLAHVFFLQHLMDMEALSAGVWYVAIDFQLYVLVLLALWGVSAWGRWRTRRGAMWRPDALRLQVFLALTVLSLLRWNLNTDLDLYGVYFFGAYGMGWLAHRARQSRIPPKGWAVLVALGLLAWGVDPRWRITTAWAVALLLAAAPASWLQPAPLAGLVQRGVALLARVSYAVFVVHYAVSLAVSALVTHFWAQSLAWNAAGMLLALALSVLVGVLLHHWVERQAPRVRPWLLAAGVFMASAGLAMHWPAASG